MNDNIIDFTLFLEKHVNTKERKEKIIGNGFVEELLNSRKVDDSIKSLLRENRKQILFRFKDSFIVGETFLLGTSKKGGWKKIDFYELKKIQFKEGGFLSVSGYFINDKHFDNYIDNPSSGKRWFSLFKEYVRKEIENNEEEIENQEKLKKDVAENQLITSLDEEQNNLWVKIVEIDKKLNGNRSLFNETKNCLKEIRKIEDEIVEVSIKIRSYYIISHLPHKFNGHSVFKGLFNYQSNLYTANQLKDIVRFLNLIRTTEKKYIDLRNELIEGLNSSDLFPVDKLSGVGGLIEIFKTINLYYNISQGLIDCIHSNKVGFNEIIIYLEDDGVFMSRPEIERLNYLKLISKNLLSIGNILMETNENMIEGFNKLNLGLKKINDSIGITNQNIDTGLSNINSTLKTGNKLMGEFIGTIENKFIEFEDEISNVKDDLSYVSNQIDEIEDGLWEVDSRVGENKSKIEGLASLTFYNTVKK